MSGGDSGPESFKSVIDEQTHSEKDDMEPRFNYGYRTCEYYCAMTRLWRPTIAELEGITGQVKSVPVLLEQTAQFYKEAEYSGDYMCFNKIEDMEQHLVSMFCKQLEKAQPRAKKDLQMKLAGGYIGVPDWDTGKQVGHALVLNFWTDDGDIKYNALDYQFDEMVGCLMAQQHQLPQDNEVEYFWCFEPFFVLY